jgi:ABC-type Mn2+/Zn2+ transport system permease subunit
MKSDVYNVIWSAYSVVCIQFAFVCSRLGKLSHTTFTGVAACYSVHTAVRLCGIDTTGHTHQTTLGGQAISYKPDLPAGATMVLLAGSAYLLATLFTDFVRRHKRLTRSSW